MTKLKTDAAASVKCHICGVKRLIKGVNRREPLLELGNTRLADDNLLGDCYRKIYAQPAAKPNRNIIYRLARDNILTIGAEELTLGKSVHNCFE